MVSISQFSFLKKKLERNINLLWADENTKRLTFGHKFSDRTGHTPTTPKTETSPVFLQWMDCIHQLILQFPCSFEFNQEMLIFILDELFGCKFGTFLGNSLKERVDLKLEERTKSVWSYLLENPKKFRNPLFASNPQVLQFSSSPRIIQFWRGFFLRWDPELIIQEDSQAKLSFMLQEMEQRQMKLKSIQYKLEAKLEKMHRESFALNFSKHKALQQQMKDNSDSSNWISKSPSREQSMIELGNEYSFPRISPYPFNRRRKSSVLAFQKINARSNVEMMVRELIEDIIENTFIVIKNRQKELDNLFTDTQNRSSSGVLNERPWIPDHWTTRCHKCLKKFSHLRRKVCFSFFFPPFPPFLSPFPLPSTFSSPPPFIYPLLSSE